MSIVRTSGFVLSLILSTVFLACVGDAPASSGGANSGVDGGSNVGVDAGSNVGVDAGSNVGVDAGSNVNDAGAIDGGAVSDGAVDASLDGAVARTCASYQSAQACEDFEANGGARGFTVAEELNVILKKVTPGASQSANALSIKKNVGTMPAYYLFAHAVSGLPFTSHLSVRVNAAAHDGQLVKIVGTNGTYFELNAEVIGAEVTISGRYGGGVPEGGTIVTAPVPVRTLLSDAWMTIDLDVSVTQVSVTIGATSAPIKPPTELYSFPSGNEQVTIYFGGYATNDQTSKFDYTLDTLVVD